MLLNIIVIVLLNSIINQFMFVTVSWEAPTHNEDGTLLDDLLGYRIYYGMATGNYSQVIDVGNKIEHTFEVPVSGKYYFAVTAYDFSGNESAFSDEVSLLVIDVPVSDSLVIDTDVVDIGNSDYLRPGSFNIYGLGRGNDSGFIFKNPGNEAVRFEFELMLTGFGVCVDTSRAFFVGNSRYMASTAVINVGTPVFTDDVLFNFTDDCFKANLSDANIEIRNLVALPGEDPPFILIAKKGSRIWLK